MKTLFKSLLLSGVFVLAQGAGAAQMYVDLGLGNADAEADIEDGVSIEGSDTYFKIALGGKISDSMAFEGGLLDLGEAEETVDGHDVSVAADGLFGNAKFSHEINSGTSIFGKVGLYLWDAEGCVSGPVINGCESDDGSDIFFGGGVSFGNFNLELLMLSLDDVDVTTIGGSFSIPFGK